MLLSALKKNTPAFSKCKTFQEAMENEAEFATVKTLKFKNPKKTPMILPVEIGKFTSLKELTISDCNLRHIPEQIGQCKALTTLLIDNNGLQQLPNELKECMNLGLINARDNNFSTEYERGLKDIFPKVKLKL